MILGEGEMCGHLQPHRQSLEWDELISQLNGLEVFSQHQKKKEAWASICMRIAKTSEQLCMTTLRL